MNSRRAINPVSKCISEHFYHPMGMEELPLPQQLKLQNKIPQKNGKYIKARKTSPHVSEPSAAKQSKVPSDNLPTPNFHTKDSLVGDEQDVITKNGSNIEEYIRFIHDLKVEQENLK